MQRDRLALRHYREERREMVRQYAGDHWSEEGTKLSVPINLISLYIQVVGRNLIAKNPRVMLSTFDRSNKPAVNAMEGWANKEIERMRLFNTLQRVVIDALFSVGICKVALATPADSAHVAFERLAGEPFAERVDLDDFVFDMHARDFSEVTYIGHRIRVPLEVVRESKLYGPTRKEVGPSYDQSYNLEGDERIGLLGRSYYQIDSQEYEDHCDLWEVYLPRHRAVLTLHDDNLTGASLKGANGPPRPLREQNWLGPDSGPYHMLGFGVVPGNTMPKAPVMDLMDLHLSINHIYRKLIRQAERQKELLLVAGGAMEDGSRIEKGNDGDIIRNDRPESAKTATFGGPNNLNQALGVHLKDMFSWLAGNLNIMGGLNPESKTATQDKMLNENSSRGIADMQDRTVQITSDVLKALCWYWWHDPEKVMRVKHQIPGMPEMSITRQVTPQQRTGSFEDLQIEIDPYSMQHATPQSRMQALNQVVQQTILPMMQLLQQQGKSFDIDAYLQKMAKYLDMPDLADIITIAEPPQQGEQGPQQEQPGAAPAETTRNYVRRSLGADTTANRESSMVDELMGAGAKQAQRNGVH